jgi:lipopolysaccharide export LptBFGC system permease protein LptF
MGLTKFIYHLFKTTIVLVVLVMVFLLAIDLIIQLSEELNNKSQTNALATVLGLIKDLDQRSLYFIEAAIIIGCALSISLLHQANTLNLLRMLGLSPQRIILYIALLPCMFAGIWIFINQNAYESKIDLSQDAQFIGDNKILVDLHAKNQVFLYEINAEKSILRSEVEDKSLFEAALLNQSKELASYRSDLEGQVDILIPLTSLILIYFIGSLSFVSKRNITTGGMIAISLGIAFTLTLIKNLLISLSIILNFSPVLLIALLGIALFLFANQRFKAL